MDLIPLLWIRGLGSVVMKVMQIFFLNCVCLAGLLWCTKEEIAVCTDGNCLLYLQKESGGIQVRAQVLEFYLTLPLAAKECTCEPAVSRCLVSYYVTELTVWSISPGTTSLHFGSLP